MDALREAGEEGASSLKNINGLKDSGEVKGFSSAYRARRSLLCAHGAHCSRLDDVGNKFYKAYKHGDFGQKLYSKTYLS